MMLTRGKLRDENIKVDPQKVSVCVCICMMICNYKTKYFSNKKHVLYEVH